MFSPGAHRVCIGSMVTNVPNAVAGQGNPSVELNGYIRHLPQPGGSYTEIRNMRVYCQRPNCPTCQRMAENDPVLLLRRPREPEPAFRGFTPGYGTFLPNSRCTCGFNVYTWQKACPRCTRPLPGSPAPLT